MAFGRFRVMKLAMRKDRLIWLAAAALLGLGVCAILVTVQFPRSGITRENFDRILDGMTEAEVEAILGGPSGRYTDRPMVVVMEGTMFRRWWIGNEGIVTIELTFDEPQRVAHKRFDPIPPETLAERCRRWCRWLPWW